MKKRADRLLVRIDLGNDAMRSPEDIARALEALAVRVRRTVINHGIIRDVNGNKVGAWAIGSRIGVPHVEDD